LVVTRRGDVVSVALPGDYGKPRPALVLQTDLMSALDSVIVCPITSDPTEAVFRVPVTPAPENGLTKPSSVMVDKISSVRRRRLGGRLGAVGRSTMRQVESALLFAAGMS
jgi:mRNA interferase MazF